MSFLHRLGRDTAYVLVGFPLALITVVLSLLMFGLGLGLSVLWIGLPVLVGAIFMARGFATVERAWIAPVLGRGFRHPAYRKGKLLTPLRDSQSWLDLLHGMFRFIPATIGFAFTLFWWVGALAGLTFPLWDWSIPRSPDDVDLPELIGLGSDTGTRALFYMSIGVLFAVTLYPVVRGSALLSAGFARAMLSGVSDLRERVAEAEAARDTAQVQKAAAVSAEATALRRLERDIHDGPQQRLVRLAMDLGRAEHQFDTDPEAARRTVKEALSQTRETLDELRALSRGIAPPILVDRGLRAALVALAGRCTVPVDLDAPEIERLDPGVETAAYFVVAEALTNVAKHSRAGVARVSMERAEGALVVAVHDDGVGGASLAKGHGLAGLDDRVRASGGSLIVDSMPGTGTRVVAALPL